ncbi:MAG: hypothetical protein EXS63_08685, partial [Candidatus Omnitrophica bacterium]|nr:hypothetical protein [Candidatus Omnitrophota bacterium]
PDDVHTNGVSEPLVLHTYAQDIAALGHTMLTPLGQNVMTSLYHLGEDTGGKLVESMLPFIMSKAFDSLYYTDGTQDVSDLMNNIAYDVMTVTLPKYHPWKRTRFATFAVRGIRNSLSQLGRKARNRHRREMSVTQLIDQKPAEYTRLLERVFNPEVAKRTTIDLQAMTELIAKFEYQIRKQVNDAASISEKTGERLIKDRIFLLHKILREPKNRAYSEWGVELGKQSWRDGNPVSRATVKAAVEVVIDLMVDVTKETQIIPELDPDRMRAALNPQTGHRLRIKVVGSGRKSRTPLPPSGSLPERSEVRSPFGNVASNARFKNGRIVPNDLLLVDPLPEGQPNRHGPFPSPLPASAGTGETQTKSAKQKSSADPAHRSEMRSRSELRNHSVRKIHLSLGKALNIGHDISLTHVGIEASLKARYPDPPAQSPGKQTAYLLVNAYGFKIFHRGQTAAPSSVGAVHESAVSDTGQQEKATRPILIEAGDDLVLTSRDRDMEIKIIAVRPQIIEIELNEKPGSDLESNSAAHPLQGFDFVPPIQTLFNQEVQRILGLLNSVNEQDRRLLEKWQNSHVENAYVSAYGDDLMHYTELRQGKKYARTLGRSDIPGALRETLDHFELDKIYFSRGVVTNPDVRKSLKLVLTYLPIVLQFLVERMLESQKPYQIALQIDGLMIEPIRVERGLASEVQIVSTNEKKSISPQVFIYTLDNLKARLRRSEMRTQVNRRVFSKRSEVRSLSEKDKSYLESLHEALELKRVIRDPGFDQTVLYRELGAGMSTSLTPITLELMRIEQTGEEPGWPALREALTEVIGELDFVTDVLDQFLKIPRSREYEFLDDLVKYKGYSRAPRVLKEYALQKGPELDEILSEHRVWIETIRDLYTSARKELGEILDRLPEVHSEMRASGQPKPRDLWVPVTKPGDTHTRSEVREDLAGVFERSNPAVEGFFKKSQIIFGGNRWDDSFDEIFKPFHFLIKAIHFSLKPIKPHLKAIKSHFEPIKSSFKIGEFISEVIHAFAKNTELAVNVFKDDLELAFAGEVATAIFFILVIHFDDSFFSQGSGNVSGLRDLVNMYLLNIIIANYITNSVRSEPRWRYAKQWQTFQDQRIEKHPSLSQTNPFRSEMREGMTLNSSQTDFIEALKFQMKNPENAAQELPLSIRSELRSEEEAVSDFLKAVQRPSLADINAMETDRAVGIIKQLLDPEFVRRHSRECEKHLATWASYYGPLMETLIVPYSKAHESVRNELIFAVKKILMDWLRTKSSLEITGKDIDLVDEDILNVTMYFYRNGTWKAALLDDEKWQKALFEAWQVNFRKGNNFYDSEFAYQLGWMLRPEAQDRWHPKLKAWIPDFLKAFHNRPAQNNARFFTTGLYHLLAKETDESMISLSFPKHTFTRWIALNPEAFSKDAFFMSALIHHAQISGEFMDQGTVPIFYVLAYLWKYLGSDSAGQVALEQQVRKAFQDQEVDLPSLKELSKHWLPDVQAETEAFLDRVFPAAIRSEVRTQRKTRGIEEDKVSKLVRSKEDASRALQVASKIHYQPFVSKSRMERSIPGLIRQVQSIIPGIDPSDPAQQSKARRAARIQWRLNLREDDQELSYLRELYQAIQKDTRKPSGVRQVRNPFRGSSLSKAAWMQKNRTMSEKQIMNIASQVLKNMFGEWIFDRYRVGKKGILGRGEKAFLYPLNNTIVIHHQLVKNLWAVYEEGIHSLGDFESLIFSEGYTNILVSGVIRGGKYKSRIYHPRWHYTQEREAVEQVIKVTGFEPLTISYFTRDERYLEHALGPYGDKVLSLLHSLDDFRRSDGSYFMDLTAFLEIVLKNRFSLHNLRLLERMIKMTYQLRASGYYGEPLYLEFNQRIDRMNKSFEPVFPEKISLVTWEKYESQLRSIAQTTPNPYLKQNIAALLNRSEMRTENQVNDFAENSHHVYSKQTLKKLIEIAKKDGAVFAHALSQAGKSGWMRRESSQDQAPVMFYSAYLDSGGGAGVQAIRSSMASELALPQKTYEDNQSFARDLKLKLGDRALVIDEMGNLLRGYESFLKELILVEKIPIIFLMPSKYYYVFEIVPKGLSRILGFEIQTVPLLPPAHSDYRIILEGMIQKEVNFCIEFAVRDKYSIPTDWDRITAKIFSLSDYFYAASGGHLGVTKHFLELFTDYHGVISAATRQGEDVETELDRVLSLIHSPQDLLKELFEWNGSHNLYGDFMESIQDFFYSLDDSALPVRVLGRFENPIELQKIQTWPEEERRIVKNLLGVGILTVDGVSIRQRVLYVAPGHWRHFFNPRSEVRDAAKNPNSNLDLKMGTAVIKFSEELPLFLYGLIFPLGLIQVVRLFKKAQMEIEGFRKDPSQNTKLKDYVTRYIVNYERLQKTLLLLSSEQQFKTVTAYTVFTALGLVAASSTEDAFTVLHIYIRNLAVGFMGYGYLCQALFSSLLPKRGNMRQNDAARTLEEMGSLHEAKQIFFWLGVPEQKLSAFVEALEKEILEGTYSLFPVEYPSVLPVWMKEMISPIENQWKRNFYRHPWLGAFSYAALLYTLGGAGIFLVGHIFFAVLPVILYLLRFFIIPVMWMGYFFMVHRDEMESQPSVSPLEFDPVFSQEFIAQGILLWARHQNIVDEDQYRRSLLVQKIPRAFLPIHFEVFQTHWIGHLHFKGASRGFFTLKQIEPNHSLVVENGRGERAEGQLKALGWFLKEDALGNILMIPSTSQSTLVLLRNYFKRSELRNFVVTQRKHSFDELMRISGLNEQELARITGKKSDQIHAYRSSEGSDPPEMREFLYSSAIEYGSQRMANARKLADLILVDFFKLLDLKPRISKTLHYYWEKGERLVSSTIIEEAEKAAARQAVKNLHVIQSLLGVDLSGIGQIVNQDQPVAAEVLAQQILNDELPVKTMEALYKKVPGLAGLRLAGFRQLTRETLDQFGFSLDPQKPVSPVTLLSWETGRSPVSLHYMLKAQEVSRAKSRVSLMIALHHSGMTREAFAGEIGVQKPALDRLISGQDDIDLALFQRVSDAITKLWESLFTGAGLPKTRFSSELGISVYTLKRIRRGEWLLATSVIREKAEELVRRQIQKEAALAPQLADSESSGAHMGRKDARSEMRVKESDRLGIRTLFGKNANADLTSLLTESGKSLRPMETLSWGEPNDQDQIVYYFRTLLAFHEYPLPRPIIVNGKHLQLQSGAMPVRPLTAENIHRIAVQQYPEAKTPGAFLQQLAMDLSIIAVLPMDSDRVEEIEHYFGIQKTGTIWFLNAAFFKNNSNFRDYMEKKRKKRDKHLKILVHAAWNGEEAYSVWIALKELYPDFHVEIIGKDFIAPNPEQLNWFPAKRVPAFLNGHLSKYFDDRYRAPGDQMAVLSLKESVRQKAPVRLMQGDIRDPSTSKADCDVVIANRVLGRYVTDEASLRKSADNLYAALKPGGIFLLEDANPEMLTKFFGMIQDRWMKPGLMQEIQPGFYQRTETEAWQAFDRLKPFLDSELPGAIVVQNGDPAKAFYVAGKIKALNLNQGKRTLQVTMGDGFRVWDRNGAQVSPSAPGLGLSGNTWIVGEKADFLLPHLNILGVTGAQSTKLPKSVLEFLAKQIQRIPPIEEVRKRSEVQARSEVRLSSRVPAKKGYKLPPLPTKQKLQEALSHEENNIRATYNYLDQKLAEFGRPAGALPEKRHSIPIKSLQRKDLPYPEGVNVGVSLRVHDGFEALGLVGVREKIEGVNFLYFLPSSHIEMSSGGRTFIRYAVFFDRRGTLRIAKWETPLEIDLLINSQFGYSRKFADYSARHALPFHHPLSILWMGEDKTFFSKLMQQAGLKMPKQKAVTASRDKDPAGKNLKARLKKIRTELMSSKTRSSELVVKPSDGSMGEDIQMFDLSNPSNIKSFEGFCESLLKKCSKIVIEERIPAYFAADREGERLDWNLRVLASWEHGSPVFDERLIYIRYAPWSQNPVNLETGARAISLQDFFIQQRWSDSQRKSFIFKLAREVKQTMMAMNEASQIMESKAGRRYAAHRPSMVGLDFIYDQDKDFYRLEANTSAVGGVGTLERMKPVKMRGEIVSIFARIFREQAQENRAWRKRLQDQGSVKEKFDPLIHVDYVLDLANVLEAAGYDQDAHVAFRYLQHYVTRGDEIQGFQDLMFSYYRLNQPARALPWARKYTRAKPSEKFGWVILGHIYDRLKKPLPAATAYANALRLNPDNSQLKEWLHELARKYPKQKDVQKINNLAQKGLRSEIRTEPKISQRWIDGLTHPDQQAIAAPLKLPTKRLAVKGLSAERLHETARKVADSLGEQPLGLIELEYGEISELEDFIGNRALGEAFLKMNEGYPQVQAALLFHHEDF